MANQLVLKPGVKLCLELEVGSSNCTVAVVVAVGKARRVVSTRSYPSQAEALVGVAEFAANQHAELGRKATK